MTQRKPPGVEWESWIDKQIREARERGEFDNLPGAGKPLPDLDTPHDDLWWVRQKLKREELQYLPPSLAVRRELEETRAKIDAATDEAEVRALVAAINERIRYVNARPGDGPPSTSMPLDVDTVVARWRAGRSGDTAQP
jgi:hypothetical protein